MPRIPYRQIDFRAPTLRVIEQADEICSKYAAQGYSLTLRQLFYQFVARDLIRNLQSEYKRLGSIVDDARYAGLLDWIFIVDRTRTLHELSHWGSADQSGERSAGDFVTDVMPQFRIEKWASQPVRVEVWIEKDALVDVVARPANGLDLPYFASRGYNSTSNAWAAAQRIEGYLDAGAEQVVVLHLGDHDPEGLDMSRDIEARFRTFLAGDDYDPDQFSLRRVALNIDQVRRFNPPPNTAKQTSSRFSGYFKEYGRTCWELEALDPPTIDALIRAAVTPIRDDDRWAEAVENERVGQELLRKAALRWPEIVSYLGMPT